MARTKVIRTLPALAKACGTFDGFRAGENHGERVRDELRAAIRCLRVSRWQPFYAMRDVADHFQVSVPTVSAIYRRLAAEGFLVVSRGSMTTVRPGGRKMPRARLTGVVAMPVWTPGFLVQSDYRIFHIECQRELQRHDMVGLPVFFQQEEELTPEFARQVCRMKPDAVLWRLPAASDRQTLEVIADSGTHVVTILDQTLDLPGGSYRVNTMDALRQAFIPWKRNGIRRLLVPLGQRLHRTDEIELETIARQSGLEATFVVPEPAELPAESVRRLEALASPDDRGIVFLSRPFYLTLWVQAPARMAALMARRRTLLLGEFDVPFLQMEERSADRIALDWHGIAHRVATDIANGTVPSPRQRVVFDAVWKPGLR